MADERPLFRPEAVDAQRQHWLGGVQLVRPPALAWITAGVLCSVVAVVAFLMLGQYTRKTTANGVVVPGGALLTTLSHSTVGGSSSRSMFSIMLFV